MNFTRLQPSCIWKSVRLCFCITLRHNPKKLCKILCALCLGILVAYFLFIGNFTLAAVSGIAIQLIFCGAMMFMMMGCNDKKDKTQDDGDQLKDTERE
ncbi:MAG: hypothetical protein V7735_24560, partial [Photobacterium frigidiphilum]|uniref:hypothetical protein n=1 Tax=Photobacterium frigidiphilum TaxID=264736 RepID=UPI0030022721